MGWGCGPDGAGGEAVAGKTPPSLPLVLRLTCWFQTKSSGSSGEGG